VACADLGGLRKEARNEEREKNNNNNIILIKNKDKIESVLE
jgi:hypothetical protein